MSVDQSCSVDHQENFREFALDWVINEYVPRQQVARGGSDGAVSGENHAQITICIAG